MMKNNPTIISTIRQLARNAEDDLDDVQFTDNTWIASRKAKMEARLIIRNLADTIIAAIEEKGI